MIGEAGLWGGLPDRAREGRGFSDEPGFESGKWLPMILSDTATVPFDAKIITPGDVFYVDGGSVLYLIGSTMDWVEDDFTAGFVFENPNAKGACGCGESFTV